MVNPLNKASLRVMEKIGMTRLGLQEFRGELDVFFQIDRAKPSDQSLSKPAGSLVL